jgi:hypothetical protein
MSCQRCFLAIAAMLTLFTPSSDEVSDWDVFMVSTANKQIEQKEKQTTDNHQECRWSWVDSFNPRNHHLVLIWFQTRWRI